MSEVRIRALSEASAIPRDALADKGHDAVAGYAFANHMGGWHADIPSLGQRHPQLMDFATWLEREGVTNHAAAQEPAWSGETESVGQAPDSTS